MFVCLYLCACVHYTWVWLWPTRAMQPLQRKVFIPPYGCHCFLGERSATVQHGTHGTPCLAVPPCRTL